MARITGLFTIITFFLWLFSLWLAPPNYDARGWSHEIFYLNGMLAWGYMALALIIAARPSWIEKITGDSLDRLYIYHRRLGWAAVILSFVHYFTKTLFGPLLSLFNLPRPEKIIPIPQTELWMQIWQQLRPIAVTSSIWLTWLMGIICLLCIIRTLRYNRWLTIHKLLSIIYIGLTLHAIRLMDTTDFLTPFGWFNIIITAAGTWASIVLLCKGAGCSKKTTGKVISSEVTNSLTVLQIQTEVHQDISPGQFIFLSTKTEAPHPFSVIDNENGQIKLAIKKLGDFTSTSVPTLKPDDTVFIEGPWGHFKPIFDNRRQTWIAAGIGIAPFMAWLKAAAQQQHGQITLCWCIRDRRKEPLLQCVEKLSNDACVNLRIFESRIIGRVSTKELLSDFPESLAVCGNTLLTAQLRRSWKKDPQDFRTEFFSWRHKN